MTIRIVAKGERFAAIVDGVELSDTWASKKDALDAIARRVTSASIRAPRLAA